MTSINWSELMDATEEGGGTFEALPADEYEVEITDSNPKVASTGKNMFVVKLRVESGPYKGRMIFNNFVISPESATARRIFKQNMSALGLDTAYFTKNPSLEQVADDLLGRRCKVRVTTRTYGGQERNEVNGVFPSSSPAPAVDSSRGSFGTPPPPSFSGEPPF